MPILPPEPSYFPAELFLKHEGPQGDDQPWWAVYLKARTEKSLARHLVAREVPFYLPLRQQQARGQGRSRLSFLPLFPGYVFFRGGGPERLEVLRSNLVVRTIEIPDQELIQEELRSLWLMERAGVPLTPHRELLPGDKVEILEGPLKGWVGTVERLKSQVRLVVRVSFFRQSVSAEVDREILVRLSGSR